MICRYFFWKYPQCQSSSFRHSNLTPNGVIYTTSLNRYPRYQSEGWPSKPAFQTFLTKNVQAQAGWKINGYQLKCQAPKNTSLAHLLGGGGWKRPVVGVFLVQMRRHSVFNTWFSSQMCQKTVLHNLAINPWSRRVWTTWAAFLTTLIGFTVFIFIFFFIWKLLLSWLHYAAVWSTRSLSAFMYCGTKNPVWCSVGSFQCWPLDWVSAWFHSHEQRLP